MKNTFEIQGKSARNAQQMAMAHQVARLHAKALKQAQAHVLCRSLVAMLKAKR
jgi:hypothetical protein